MRTRYPIINRVSELKVHIELTRFVQPEKIEIDANERAVNEKSQYCFFVCTTFDSFLNDLLNCSTYWNFLKHFYLIYLQNVFYLTPTFLPFGQEVSLAQRARSIPSCRSQYTMPSPRRKTWRKTKMSPEGFFQSFRSEFLRTEYPPA